MNLEQPDFNSNGLYKDLSLLADGARGTTWRAKDPATDRDVVLKVRDRTSASEALARREAAIFQNIKHPNVQGLQSLALAEEKLILQYDFVSGKSLREVLKLRGPLPNELATNVLRDILSALVELHSHDIAHRDISPENIILSDHGAVLIDFDATGYLDKSSPLGATTLVGDFAGKFLYMSPEGLAGAPQSAATDIWALGAVFYEMRVGNPLRRGKSFPDIFAEGLAPVDLSSLPQQERMLAAQMLTTDAGQRPSAKDLLAQIELAQIETEELFDDPFIWMGDAPAPPIVEESSAPPVIQSMPEKRAHKSAPQPLGLILGLLLLGLMGGVSLSWLGGWNWSLAHLSNDALFAIGLLLAGILLCAFGLLLLSKQLRSPPEPDLSDNLKEMIGVDGADGRKALMRTVIGNLEPEVKRGNVVQVQIAALAQEYVEAKNSSERLEALKVLIDVHHRASTKNRSIWRSPDRMIQRAISLTSLAGGAATAYEGLSRLFA